LCWACAGSPVRRPARYFSLVLLTPAQAVSPPSMGSATPNCACFLRGATAISA
jgi:hypothetical protein